MSDGKCNHPECATFRGYFIDEPKEVLLKALEIACEYMNKSENGTVYQHMEHCIEKAKENTK